jgi:hypothetical protein
MRHPDEQEMASATKAYSTCTKRRETMINVTIAENGNIVMRCANDGCGKFTTVEASWGVSPFWDMFCGQAILMMLGHIRREH